ncbi:Uncharacterised protein [Vibrio cholerae]|nr:Uncharacterised protein [Vibrio cholerae]CSI69258.1 Uncharacterised protein [Vibrio cholerae]
MSFKIKRFENDLSVVTQHFCIAENIHHHS